MRSRKRLAAVLLGLVSLIPLGAAAAKEKKPQQPFYRKYLVPGDPLDERILEQERRVAANPSSPELLNDLGNLLAARRFPEQARQQYELALELDDEHFLAAYNLGLLYETEGKISKAIGAYRKSIGRKPGFPQSQFRLGRLYEQRGWEGLAIEHYAKALRIEPLMRDPRHNPLVVDTRLLYRASLRNYQRDLASASLLESAAFAEAGFFSRVPTDRTLWSQEVIDPSAPEPVDAAAPVILPQPAGARPPMGNAIAPPPPEPEQPDVEMESEAPPEAPPPPPPAANERPPFIGGFVPRPTRTPTPN